MKSKTLLIAAAALAAGVMTSQAQVYSQNIVGYINVPLNAGYNLIANQLDVDGSGLNNSIYSAVGTNFVPLTTSVLCWNGSSFTTIKLLSNHTWSGAASAIVTNAMNPGAGFFIDVPAATNVTFVGNVILGTNTYTIPAGYQIVSLSGPTTNTIDGGGYHPGKIGSTGDQLLVWNGSSFTTHKWLGSSWTGGDPVLSVSQSVFLDSVNNTNWTQILNVQ
jgi:hypothetical protein